MLSTLETKQAATSDVKLHSDQPQGAKTLIRYNRNWPPLLCAFIGVVCYFSIGLAGCVQSAIIHERAADFNCTRLGLQDVPNYTAYRCNNDSDAYYLTGYASSLAYVGGSILIFVFGLAMRYMSLALDGAISMLCKWHSSRSVAKQSGQQEETNIGDPQFHFWGIPIGFAITFMLCLLVVDFA